MSRNFKRLAAVVAVIGSTCLAACAASGQTTPPPRTTPVGFPQDAGPHDKDSTIEWWYFNSFLTTESGKKYAVVGSFFRTGLTPNKKGHYLIYALVDLDKKTKTAYSVLDQANLELLKGLLPLLALQKPDDPRPLQLLAQLQKNQLPAPHQALPKMAVVSTAPRFAITMNKNALAQKTNDARTWRANLVGDDFALDLTLRQPDRPPMLVGGQGKTGLGSPDDMFYVSLTRMETAGVLRIGNGPLEKVTGVGWLDRQWGRSWVVGDNGWDWFGVQLSDGSDLIVYQVKDNTSGKVLRAEATLLRADGTQVVDKAPVFTPDIRALWTDPATGITYLQTWRITLPTLNYALTVSPAFPNQTIPVLGIGEAIWEGVVEVGGVAPGAKPVQGRGYMELVGYKTTGKIK